MSQHTLRPVRVGLLGIGTVGSGTFEVLRRNQAEIRRRAGRGIEIAAVVAGGKPVLEVKPRPEKNNAGGDCEKKVNPMFI